ncbi:transglycosylase domain-containing protein [Mycoplasmatota bacterium WC44]
MNLSSILKISIVLSIIALFSSYTYIFHQLPDEIYNLKRTSYYDNTETVYLSTINDNFVEWVTLEEISPFVVDSLLSIEDKNFYSHSGFDSLRIIKAFYTNIVSNNIEEGASTLTQQYVKNMFLTNSQTYRRKIKEFYLAVLIENKYTKNQILEAFLNSVYFGHGIYGIENAANFFYNKSANSLTLIESASLISILNGPEIYSPLKELDNNISRTNLILKQMYKDKKIDVETYLDNINVRPMLDVNKDTKSNIFYFQTEITKLLNNIDYKRRFSTIDVYTTLDIRMYKKANNLTEQIPALLETSIYVMEPTTGNVLTIIGGRKYSDSEFNRATDAYRQPGSSIKPFLYYSALERGFDPYTTFESTPTTFYINGTNTYAPDNYNDRYLDSDITMLYALATSDNIYAVKTLLFLGVNTFNEVLNNFNFSKTVKPNPTLALGTNEVSLEELTSAYNYFASNGTKANPKILKRVIVNGTTVYIDNKNHSSSLNVDDTFVMNQMLTHIFNKDIESSIHVTGYSLSDKLSHKYSAKSGSTDYDNWMVGYNPQITIGVWTGYDNNNKLMDEDLGYAKKIWAELIEFYMLGREDIWFKQTDNIKRIRKDLITGQNTGSNLDYIYYKVT